MATLLQLNKYKLLFILMFGTALINAQTYDLWVFASAGSQLSGPQFSAVSTLGEPVTGFIQTSFFSAQQGYHIFEEVSENTHTYNHEAKSLKVYPVPFKDRLMVERHTDSPENIEIRIHDATGKVVHIQRETEAGSMIIIRHLSHLPGGYYTLKVIEKGSSKVYPVLKK